MLVYRDLPGESAYLERGVRGSRPGAWHEDWKGGRPAACDGRYRRSAPLYQLRTASSTKLPTRQAVGASARRRSAAVAKVSSRST